MMKNNNEEDNNDNKNEKRMRIEETRHCWHHVRVPEDDTVRWFTKRSSSTWNLPAISGIYAVAVAASVEYLTRVVSHQLWSPLTLG